jgi:hypothetical protein
MHVVRRALRFARGPRSAGENGRVTRLFVLNLFRRLARVDVRKLRPSYAALIAIALTTTLGAASAHADKAQESAQAVLTVHQFLHDEPSADPDRAMLRYGILGGRWQAMAGERIVLIGGPLGHVRAAIALEGFIELVNFTDEQPVPWESFRANIGINTHWEAPSLARAILPPGGRLSFAFGWFHESDHAANLQRYKNDYLNNDVLNDFGGFSHFDNANFSAYEYFKLRLCWQQLLWGNRITTQTAIAARLFTPSINPGSIRAMNWAFQSEVRLSVRATKTIRPFVAGFFEFIDNDFVAAREGFRGGLDREPLRYQTISAGLELRARGGSIVTPEVIYSNSHGRGIDFPRFYGPELGFRLGFLL